MVGRKQGCLRVFPVAALALALAVLGCSTPLERPAGGSAPAEDAGPKIGIIMKNDSGQHLTLFELDYGSGAIKYQIFSENYTFQEQVPVPGADTPVTVSYHDQKGLRHSFTLERPLSPEMSGGWLRVRLNGEEPPTISFDWP